MGLCALYIYYTYKLVQIGKRIKEAEHYIMQQEYHQIRFVNPYSQLTDNHKAYASEQGILREQSPKIVIIFL